MQGNVKIYGFYVELRDMVESNRFVIALATGKMRNAFIPFIKEQDD